MYSISWSPHNCFLTLDSATLNMNSAGRGSSVVEQRTENPRVGSSTLPLGTRLMVELSYRGASGLTKRPWDDSILSIPYLNCTTGKWRRETYAKG